MGSSARKRDVKQFRQACNEVGLTSDQRYRASEDLHAEKEVAAVRRRHLSYGELVAWLREWKER